MYSGLTRDFRRNMAISSTTIYYPSAMKADEDRSSLRGIVYCDVELVALWRSVVAVICHFIER
jgi:hypothetical protein